MIRPIDRDSLRERVRQSKPFAHFCIDDFLEGKEVSEEVLLTIRRFHTATEHKRSLPVEVPSGGGAGV